MNNSASNNSKLRKLPVKGRIVVISAPSGSGKSTIISEIMKVIKNLQYSISATTRKPRGTEKNGIEYYFLSKEEFNNKIKNDEFVEYKTVFDNYYGTLKEVINNGINNGTNIIFDIDVQGALTIKELYKEAILIFIYPPSIEELKKRLIRRKTDTIEEIEKRLSYFPKEMKLKDKYDYQVENDTLEKAIVGVIKILKMNNIN